MQLVSFKITRFDLKFLNIIFEMTITYIHAYMHTYIHTYIHTGVPIRSDGFQT